MYASPEDRKDGLKLSQIANVTLHLHVIRYAYTLTYVQTISKNKKLS